MVKTLFRVCFEDYCFGMVSGGKAFRVTKYLTSICQSTFHSLRKSLQYFSVLLSRLRGIPHLFHTFAASAPSWLVDFWQRTVTIGRRSSSFSHIAANAPSLLVNLSTHQSQCIFTASRFVHTSQPMHLHH